MRWAIRIAVIVGIVAALFIGRFVYQGMSKSREAERALHASSLTVQLLDAYVDQHDGNWPRSWHDLEEMPATEFGVFQWPQDSHEVQRYVEVDFAVDPHVVAEQGGNVVDAVTPICPVLSIEELESMKDLLTYIRENMKN
jgi:hypothetical protein